MTKDLQNKIDAIREEFQDQRPDVVMVLDELVESQRWQPIETAPKDGEAFLALDSYGAHECCYDKHGRLCYKVWSNIKKPKFLTWYHWDLMCRFGITPHPTHWKPLGQPPKAGE